MKLKDFLSNVTENKRNGQWTTSIRKNKLKKAGITKKELMDIDVNINKKLKKHLFED